MVTLITLVPHVYSVNKAYKRGKRLSHEQSKNIQNTKIQPVLLMYIFKPKKQKLHTD